MDTPEITNEPERYLATEVELESDSSGHWEWVDGECAGCGGEHHYGAGEAGTDPRKRLGHRAARCLEPATGTPAANAAKTLNLSLRHLVLIDADPRHTEELLAVSDGCDSPVSLEAL